MAPALLRARVDAPDVDGDPGQIRTGDAPLRRGRGDSAISSNGFRTKCAKAIPFNSKFEEQSRRSDDGARDVSLPPHPYFGSLQGRPESYRFEAQLAPEATPVIGMDLLVLLLMLGHGAVPPAASGVVQEEIAATTAEAVEAADIYADCAGWWDFMASHERASGRPASAEQFKNMGNGAQTAALWLHGQAYSLTATKPARYGTWLPMVAPRREGAAIRAAAMVEHGKTDFVRSELQRCEALLEGQQQAIDSIRKDNVQRELDASTSGD